MHELQNLIPEADDKNLIDRISYRCISTLTEEQKYNIQENKPIDTNILITTPQIFLNLFGSDSSRTQLLSHVKYIVLDECDKYF